MTEMLRGGRHPSTASVTRCHPGKTDEVWLICRNGQNDPQMPVDTPQKSQNNTETQENKRHLPPPCVSTFYEATVKVSAWRELKNSCSD